MERAALAVHQPQAPQKTSSGSPRTQRPFHMQRIRAYLALFLLGLSATAAAQLDTASWIMVDTAPQTLTVKEGDHIKKVFSNISVGRHGPAAYRTQGAGRTQHGIFHLAWFYPN